MAWIKNIPLCYVTRTLKKWIPFEKDETILIQIVDPEMSFPEPRDEFKEIYQFKFYDIDREIYGRESITDKQAEELVDILKHALERNINVIVHCVAGVCRSGAVTEVGVIMGFDEFSEPNRIPNVLVKNKMLKCLGLTY